MVTRRKLRLRITSGTVPYQNRRNFYRHSLLQRTHRFITYLLNIFRFEYEYKIEYECEFQFQFQTGLLPGRPRRNIICDVTRRAQQKDSRHLVRPQASHCHSISVKRPEDEASALQYHVIPF